MARRRKKVSESGLHKLADYLFHPKRLCLIALLSLGGISIPFLARHVPDLREQPEYVITVNDIHVTEPPEWVPRDIAQQIYDRAGLPQEMSLLDEGLVQQVVEAYQTHPWIKSVKQVRKQQPASVFVDVTYRKAVALIEVREGLYPVDADGVLLPPRDFRQKDVYQYPIVGRVRSTPAGPAGEEWGDPVVLGAARIAEVLSGKNHKGERYWKALGAQRIESPVRIAADDNLDDLIYRLRTPRGSEIIWGRAPGTGHPGEVTADKKIRRLETYLADYGGYETAHGPSELDIRHWHEISHRALATKPTGPRQ